MTRSWVAGESELRKISHAAAGREAPAVPGPEVAPDLVAVVVPAASRADPEAGVAVNQREEAPRRPNLVIAATLDRGRGAPVDLGLKVEAELAEVTAGADQDLPVISLAMDISATVVNKYSRSFIWMFHLNRILLLIVLITLSFVN